jgi:hypothetical protein
VCAPLLEERSRAALRTIGRPRPASLARLALLGVGRPPEPATRSCFGTIQAHLMGTGEVTITSGAPEARCALLEHRRPGVQDVVGP